jgi:hypothetical protein
MVGTAVVDEKPVDEQPATKRTLRQRWIVWRLERRRALRVWIRDLLGLSQDLHMAGLWIEGVRKDMDAVAKSQSELVKAVQDLRERLAWYEEKVPALAAQRKRLDRMRADGMKAPQNRKPS